MMVVQKLRKFSLFFILLSCASANITPLSQKVEAKKEEKKVLPEITPQSISVKNGQLEYIEMNLPLADGTYEAICSTENLEAKPDKLKFRVKTGTAKIYYSEDYYSEETQRTCALEDGRVILNVEISQFPYKEEQLRVAKSKVVLSEEAKKRVEKEWLMTRDIYNSSAPEFLFDQPFRMPLYTKITSDFGKRRVFNDLKKTSHLGTDFRAAVGVKIPVANSGRVVFVGDLFYTGNVVIVDHGMDIFTLYAHLSRIDVQQGQPVVKGQIIGLAGKTGRVSGPHLHWGVKVAGKAADGASLVESSKKQFGLK